MGTALPEADTGTAAKRGDTRNWVLRHPGLLAAFVYLATAFALNWRLWRGLGTMSAVGDPGPADNDLMAWFMRYAADAIAHGHLPALVTTALNAPHGIPLMWNNSVLFPAVALTPVTLLAGPLAGLTVLLTLGYAGSAGAMYWLLRRHGASVLAGGLGGAVFGFSPGMLNAGIDHYGMQFALLTPLMIEAVASIITGRGSPLAAGARLGLLAAAQLFTGEEMLTDVAIASLVLVAVLGASRPSAVRARLRRDGPRPGRRCRGRAADLRLRLVDTVPRPAHRVRHPLVHRQAREPPRRVREPPGPAALPYRLQRRLRR